MAELKITRPAASSVFTVETRKGDNFAFAFEAGDFIMSREGESLVLTFEDGGRIVIENFYVVYSKEEMPTFSFGDVVVSAEDIFLAQNAEGLMPAAGSSAGIATGVQGAGGTHEVSGHMELAEGTYALGTLSWDITEGTENRSVSFENIRDTTDEMSYALGTLPNIATNEMQSAENSEPEIFNDKPTLNIGEFSCSINVEKNEFSSNMDFTKGRAGEEVTYDTSIVDLSGVLVQFHRVGEEQKIFLDCGENHPDIIKEEGVNPIVKYSDHYNDDKTNHTDPKERFGLDISYSSDKYFTSDEKTQASHYAEISYDLAKDVGQGLAIDLHDTRMTQADIVLGGLTKADNEKALLIFYGKNDLSNPVKIVETDWSKEKVDNCSFELNEVSQDHNYRIGSIHIDNVNEYGRIVIASYDTSTRVSGTDKTRGGGSDNEFTIRSLSFSNEAENSYIKTFAGTLDVNSGKDGFIENDYAVLIDVDALTQMHYSVDGTSIDDKLIFFINDGDDSNQDKCHSILVCNENKDHPLYECRIEVVENNQAQWSFKQYEEFSIETTNDDLSESFGVVFCTVEDKIQGDTAEVRVSIPVESFGEIGDSVREDVNTFCVRIEDVDGKNFIDDHVANFNSSDKFEANIVVDLPKNIENGFELELNIHSFYQKNTNPIILTYKNGDFWDGDNKLEGYDAEANTFSYKVECPAFDVTATQRGAGYTVTASNYLSCGGINLFDGDIPIEAAGTLGTMNWNSLAKNDFTGGNYYYHTSGQSLHGVVTGQLLDGYADDYLKFDVTNFDNNKFDYKNEDGFIVLTSKNNAFGSNGSVEIKIDTATGEYTYNSNLQNNEIASFDIGIGVNDKYANISFGNTTMRFNLQGGNDYPELSFAINANNQTNELGRFVADSINDTGYVTGNVVSSETGTKCFVFHQGATNLEHNGKGNGSGQDGWLDGLNYSERDCLYNEHNFNTWMSDFQEQAYTSKNWSNSKWGFLHTPKEEMYNSVVSGKYGSFEITEDGTYTYNLYDKDDLSATINKNGPIGETFSLLVVDENGSFSVKDITFSLFINNNNLECQYGSPDAFISDIRDDQINLYNTYIDENTNIFYTEQAQRAYNLDTNSITKKIDIDVDEAEDLGTEGALLLGAQGGGQDTIDGSVHDDIIFAGAKNDTVQGLNGNDRIHGGDGNDNLSGNDGHDELYGDLGTDTLDGGPGDDFLDGGLDADTLLGYEGNDILVFSSQDTLNGGDGIDFLLGGSNLNVTKNGGKITNMDFALATDVSLTNYKDLESKLGISFKESEVFNNKFNDAHGRHIYLDDNWTIRDDNSAAHSPVSSDEGETSVQVDAVLKVMTNNGGM